MCCKKILSFLLLHLWVAVYFPVEAQITAPGSSGSAATEYATFAGTDSIYLFCAGENEAAVAVLQAATDLTGTKTFLWEKYNPASGNYDFYFSESTEQQETVISGLEDGGYRVTITLGGTESVYRAWVFSNRLTASASAGTFDCESLALLGEFTAGSFLYYDPTDNTPAEVFTDVQVEWLRGETVIGATAELHVGNPPAGVNTYRFRVYDRFGCEATATVEAEGGGPAAAFTASPLQGEAPLTVTFTNQSVNADPDLYEWFFYRDLDEIKRESETAQQPVDSIMIVDYNQNPVFTFESSGTYKVALVAKAANDSGVCTDTVYIDDYIRVDTSFIAVPNVFTPNGDGDNDNFIVQFWSMESIKISIFNRWGKRIHFWESNNVRGFDETYTATVWDGRSGGRFATPGVYYYVVEGRGRDNKTRKAHGFFHLFRGKD